MPAVRAATSDPRPGVVPDVAGKVDDRVEVGVDPRALGGGEVARPEDDRLEPVAGGGDLVDVLQALGLLDQHLERDPLAQPERLLQLGEQHVDPPDVPRPADLGHDDHVERLAGDGDDLDDVAVGPVRVDAVHPDRAGGASPVEVAQRPGRLAARLLPARRARRRPPGRGTPGRRRRRRPWRTCRSLLAGVASSERRGRGRCSRAT